MLANGKKLRRSSYGGLAELADALDLGSSVERRAGSSPVSPTKWLRSTEVVHFLGKEEVGGSIPLGASTIITMKHRGFRAVVV